MMTKMNLAALTLAALLVLFSGNAMLALNVAAADEPAAKSRETEETKKADTEIGKKLDTKRVSVDFKDASFADVISYLRHVTGMNFVISSKAAELIEKEDPKVTLKLKNIQIKSALLQALEPSGKLTYGIKHGVVLIIVDKPEVEKEKDDKPASETEEKDKTKKASTGIGKKLETKRVSVDFKDASFADVISYLRHITGMNFVISSKAAELIEKEDPKVTLKLKNIQLKNALLLVLETSGELTYVIKNGAILIIITEVQEADKPAPEPEESEEKKSADADIREKPRKK